ncbi:hypothetical protein CYMTET_24075 [Cymbomonas tetramitiformis]|uniref:SMCHD1 ribosomal S5 domain-containing protein n=1 Tax=Cymbomonas tetramitiformis TaxID=36881 RepID=A0AAE0FX31_9CHLO|nr:hypothetical protein CYMTET_24075 [Cymbomonas tetramitiformis]
MFGHKSQAFRASSERTGFHPEGNVWVQNTGNEGAKKVRMKHRQDLAALKLAVQQRFSPSLDAVDFLLTDTSIDIQTDSDLATVIEDAVLFVVLPEDRRLGDPLKERITFQPHPKTMTMAGDYEYFASQGKHPFVYALAELVDNSLRAMRNVDKLQRQLSIYLLIGGSASESAICVQDAGVGMTPHELNQWAVMNLSMNDRGQQPEELALHGCSQVVAKAAHTRHLTSDLSYFGVGSKNACFYLGASTRVSTRQAGSRYVHELCIAANELERRYVQQQGSVWEEDLLHRNAADTGTLPSAYATQPVLERLLREEESEGSPSFTRVLVSDLKEDVYEQLQRGDAGSACTDLAHIYHFYLHGPQGACAQAPAPGSQGSDKDTTGVAACPEEDEEGAKAVVVVEQWEGQAQCWRRDLRQVTDDLLSQYLVMQRSEFTFALEVAGKGLVEGVLYYFPYDMDHETMPVDPRASGTRRKAAGASAVACLQAVQEGTQAMGTQAGSRDSEEDGEEEARPGPGALFQTFWQGRLIPETAVASLPFIHAVAGVARGGARGAGRTAAARDVLPDECFARLRGLLFFGPSFKVTRNKLSFRDNLEALLDSSTPLERSMERKFREWLLQCHTSLDKHVLFEGLLPAADQAAARKQHGESVTLFEHAVMDKERRSQGERVRLAMRPAVVGEIAFFSVAGVVHEGGAYASGLVWVRPLPEEIYGSDARISAPLRRLQGGALSESEVQEHVMRERLKGPSSLQLQPMSLSSGRLALEAGDEVPESTVAVSTGAGNRVTRAQLGGSRVALVVVQTLRFHPEMPASKEAPVPEKAAPAKKRRRGRSSADQMKGDAGVAGEGEDADAGEVVTAVRNATPVKDCYQFQPILAGLKRAGRYTLEYTVERPEGVGSGMPALRMVAELRVKPGAATSFSLEGTPEEGCEVCLGGAALPGPLTVVLFDEYGNRADRATRPSQDPLPVSFEVSAEVAGGEPEGVADTGVSVQASKQDPGKGVVHLAGLAFVGPPDGEEHKLAALFSSEELPQQQQAVHRQGLRGGGKKKKASGGDVAAPAVVGARLMVTVLVKGLHSTCNTFRVHLLPGAPTTLSLVPGHPFTHAAVDSEPELALTVGSPVPEWRVVACDRWGNRTGPSAERMFHVEARCDILEVPRQCFEVTEAGVAVLDAMQVRQNACTQEAAELTVRLRQGAPSPQPGGSDDAEMVDAGLEDGSGRLRCWLHARASPAVARLVLMRDGVEVGGVGMAGAAEDEEDVEPGSSAGLPVVAPELPGGGRFSTSWTRGSKKAKGAGLAQALPRMPVAEAAGEEQAAWVRFLADSGESWVLAFAVLPSAGAPHAWGMTVIEEGGRRELGGGAARGTGTAAGATGTVGRGGSAAAGSQGMGIPCGEEFRVEIEMVDAHGNVCAPGTRLAPGLAALMPHVVAEAARPATLKVQEGSACWRTKERGDIFVLSAVLLGEPGEVTLRVVDRGPPCEDSGPQCEDAEGAASGRLMEDSLKASPLTAAETRV